uniref:Cyclophilin-like peptidyl-prolyl cis-trans isomerase domain-containing protein n=1 Tax=Tanacetum cinerariifolium TaxID=118510 RepID=A0A6L2LXS1_TANCI|nr:cyclophilin-like peptidyl-prolyl cis-trans isomerase domain-containing protein [Tanacetum cinerariifolium]
MGDEHLNTILATESNEFINSCVKNLIPNPSESKGENGCDIDSLLDEFVGELTLLKSIPPGIDETDCDPENEIRLTKILLYDNSSPHPPEEFVSKNSNAEIESFSPSPIPVEDSDSLMEEIDLSFMPDDLMPPGIEEDDDDSERDILILEEFLDNYSLSLPENESFRFDIPSFSRPPAKPPDDSYQRILSSKSSFPYLYFGNPVDDEVRLEDDWVPLDEQLDANQLRSKGKYGGGTVGKGCFKCGSLDHIARDYIGTLMPNELQNIP